MRGFLAVFAHFSVCAEAASQAYSMAFCLSTSKQCFLCFIKRAQEPPSMARFGGGPSVGVSLARLYYVPSAVMMSMEDPDERRDLDWGSG
jgi:hypothetical protein